MSSRTSQRSLPILIDQGAHLRGTAVNMFQIGSTSKVTPTAFGLRGKLTDARPGCRSQACTVIDLVGSSDPRAFLHIQELPGRLHAIPVRPSMVERRPPTTSIPRVRVARSSLVNEYCKGRSRGSAESIPSSAAREAISRISRHLGAQVEQAPFEFEVGLNGLEAGLLRLAEDSAGNRRGPQEGGPSRGSLRVGEGPDHDPLLPCGSAMGSISGSRCGGVGTGRVTWPVAAHSTRGWKVAMKPGVPTDRKSWPRPS